MFETQDWQDITDAAKADTLKKGVRSRYAIRELERYHLGDAPKFGVYRDGVLICSDDTMSDAEASIRADMDERDDRL